MGRRLRQHTNPLSFRGVVERPDWAKIFPRRAPWCLEIGFGRGEFLFALAALHPERDYVGLEVRKVWVEQVRARLAAEGRPNIHLVYCNANSALPVLFDPGQLQEVYINFPDPWPKREHHKRRLVTPALVSVLWQQLRPSGLVYVQTDVAELAQEIGQRLEAGGFVNLFGPRQVAPDKTLPVWSHRERAHLRRGEVIYRFIFQRPDASNQSMAIQPVSAW